MKKILLVFAIFLAFAVKSFAYTGSASYTLYEVGSLTEWITLNSQSAGADMGCFNPGYVEVTFSASNPTGSQGDHLTERVDYPGDSKSFYWINPTSECKVTIVVYQILDPSEPMPNGTNVGWSD